MNIHILEKDVISAANALVREYGTNFYLKDDDIYNGCCVRHSKTRI